MRPPLDRTHLIIQLTIGDRKTGRARLDSRWATYSSIVIGIALPYLAMVCIPYKYWLVAI
jgi:hypothetical protein